MAVYDTRVLQGSKIYLNFAIRNQNHIQPFQRIRFYLKKTTIQSLSLNTKQKSLV